MERAIIVVDLGYGDSGKGTMVDYLTRITGAKLNVRFNGGAQAAHNVVLPDGRHHTFSQFGSGMFLPDVKTYLSQYMLIDPIALMNEKRHLEQLNVPNPLGRLIIHPLANIVTPWHVIVGQLRELKNNHGSCGMGIGETMRMANYGINLAFTNIEGHKSNCLYDNLCRIRDCCYAVAHELGDPYRHELFDDIFNDNDVLIKFIDTAAEIYEHTTVSASLLPYADGTVIFEGAQGILLDHSHGFHPHTTWSNCTPGNALSLIPRNVNIKKIGVTRSYATRHGDGPLVTEDAQLKQSIHEMHNKDHKWQHSFRVGWLDLMTLKYAIKVSGVDSIAMTCLDQLPIGLLCTSYGWNPDEIPYNPPLVLHDSFEKIIEQQFYSLGNYVTSRGHHISSVYDDNLKAQEAITRKMLNSVAPDFDAGVDYTTIGARLGVPIEFTSTGPTFVDKHIHC